LLAEETLITYSHWSLGVKNVVCFASLAQEETLSITQGRWTEESGLRWRMARTGVSELKGSKAKRLRRRRKRKGRGGSKHLNRTQRKRRRRRATARALRGRARRPADQERAMERQVCVCVSVTET
jgi:hypothetical protein